MLWKQSWNVILVFLSFFREFVYWGWIRSRDKIQNAIRCLRVRFVFDVFSLFVRHPFYIRHVISKITCCILLIDCSLIALLLMHICSAIVDMGPGPRTKAQRAVGRGLRDQAPRALGPYPLWLNKCPLMAISRQSICNH